jgi:hypothetical protein
MKGRRNNKRRELHKRLSRERKRENIKETYKGKEIKREETPHSKKKRDIGVTYKKGERESKRYKER